jgi:hypothetical protein
MDLIQPPSIFYFKNTDMKKLILVIILTLSKLTVAQAPVTDILFAFTTGRTFMEMVENRNKELRMLDFDYELLKEYIRLNHPKNKRVLLSQAVLESNYFSSDIFQENNNLFGMKTPKVRPNNVQGTNRGHAIYDHWTSSVDDYIMWYKYMTRNKTYNNYYKFLSSINYAEDPSYIPKLKRIENLLFEQLI